MNFDLLAFTGPVSLAEAAAQRFIEEVFFAHDSTPFYVALPGGRITQPLFGSVASQCRTRGCDISRIHFFWSDERCVPPTDPESNFAAAQEHLLLRLNVADGQIHRIRGEIAPEAAVSEAEAEVRRYCPADSNGWPMFDLILLGMGEDGHVASLFPDAPDAEDRGHAIYRPVRASKPPPLRISMTYDVIASARKVWILASGPGKERALRESLDPNGKTPLARVLRSRDHSTLFTDIKIG